MRKKIILGLLLISATTSISAQLKVNSNGSVKVGANAYHHPNLGNAPTKLSSLSGLSSGDNVGILGVAQNSNAGSSDKVVGVLGIARNGGSGYNFGVFGYLGGDQYGAAVFGSTYSGFASPIQGYYAGFFDGPVMTNGRVTANEVVTTSDLRLKKDVLSVSESESGNGFLDRLLSMNVIEYKLKDRAGHSQTKEESTRLKQAVREKERKHYGLAAQELQEIFPNLVVEEQDGYLGINYVELVPVLIRSIQELKQELDDIKGGSKTRAAAGDDEASYNAASSQNVLYQNSPNPFKENTVIRFRLADNAQDAAICIFDMSGKLVKKMPISSGDERVSVAGYELGEGLYLYSLIVNGQEIDTKKMVITK